MKNKILSIALVLGILLSIISSIPVSAAGEVYERSLPYAFYDYEDGVNNLAGATIVDGGVSGSGKCLQYISTATTHEDKVISLGAGGTIPANHTFKLSFNLMLPQELTRATFFLHLSGYPSCTVDATKVGEWQKVEFTYTPTADTKISSVSMRYGGHGTIGNHIPGGAAEDPRTYYIDDMEITVTSPYQSIPGSGGDDSSGNDTPVVKSMTLNDYTMDFEDGSSVQLGGKNVTTTEAGSEKYKTQLIADPEDADNTVMKVWLASDVSGEGQYSGKNQNNNAFGKMLFSQSTASTTAATGTIPAGATFKMTFRYYLPQEVESSNNPSFCFYYTAGSVRRLIPTEAPSATHNQWHTVEMKWTNSGSSALSLTQSAFRICGNNDSGNGWKTSWTAKGYGSTDNGTTFNFGDRAIYFDDFRIVVDDPNAAPPPEEADLSLNSYAMDFETDSSIQVNGANITDVEAGLADELAVITADPENAENKVMKLTTTSSYAASASTIKFSGATGEGTDKVTAPGKIPAGGKITYTFKYYLASEVDTTVAPAFSVKHATGNVTATSATNFSTEANVWHEAKLTYTNNGAAINLDGATLRIAGDDANTTQWKAADGDTVIYFDDFTVETAEPAFPTSADLRFTGDFAEGEEVIFSHTYTPAEEGAEDKSIVRFLYTKNGVTGSLGSCLIGTEFTVPAIPKGGVLSFEVVPVDSGILGVKIPYSYASVVGQYATLNLSDFAADGSVTATAMVENRREDLTDINAVLIVVMFNEKGYIVKYDEKPVACANDDEVTETLTLTTDNADPALSKVSKASAYLWYCVDGQTASFTNSTLVELVEDESVLK